MSARILVVDDVETNVRLLEAKLTIEFLSGFRRGLHVDHNVCTFRMLLNIVGKTALAPDIDLLQRATFVRDNLKQLVNVNA